jgi:two-component system, OmpR family, sensor kinase
MKIPFFNRLYVRMWLAVVLTVLLLTVAFGWLWRSQAERIRTERMAELPAREMVVRDASGQVIGQASARRVPGQGLFELRMPDGKTPVHPAASARPGAGRWHIGQRARAAGRATATLV